MADVYDPLELLQLVQQIAGFGVFEVTLATGATFWSPCMFALLGRQSEHGSLPVDRFIDDYVNPAFRQSAHAAYSAMLASGVDMDVECPLVDGQGSQRYARVQARVAAGRVVGTLRDITDRRRKEDELRRMHERLMYVARASLMGEMSSGVAHELNQPLASIATYAQAAVRLLQRPEPEVTESLNALQQISAQALRAGAVIRSLRTLGAVALERESVDLQVLIDDACSYFDNAVAAGLDLHVHRAPTAIVVKVERSQIQHVLMALLQNAIDATAHLPRPQARITVQTLVVDNRAEVVVGDNGSGISPEVDGQLFKPFFTTKSNGAGLGLVSSRSIIEAHGGKMGCAAVPAGGARFWFRLPLFEPNGT